MITRTFLTTLLIGSLFVPQLSHAAEKLHYFSTSARSESELFLLERGLLGDTSYRCSIAGRSCEEVATSTSLLPQALADTTFYHINPGQTRVITTTFIPYSSPVHALMEIKGDRLVEIEKIPVPLDITRVRWGADNKTMLITLADGTLTRYVLGAKSASPVTAFPTGASWVTLSPNARYAAYYLPATQSRPERVFGVVDTVSNKDYRYTGSVAYWDLLTEGVRLFSFSPDSSQLLYLDDRSGYPSLYKVSMANLETAGMTGEQLFTKPYSVMDFLWKDTSTIVFSANRENPLNWSLYDYNVNSFALKTITNSVSYDSEMVRLGDSILFYRIVENARLPYLLNLSSGSVAAFSIPGLTLADTTPGQVVKKGNLSGVLMKPSGATKTLLVWLHGGPYRQVSTGYHPYFSYAGYDWMLEQVRNSGVAVLKLDYPGSQGYGRAFAESITGEVGGNDVEATRTAALALAKEQGYRKVYLAGNSYGGYLALKALVDHPKSFDGGFSINGVTDWDVLTQNLRTSIFNVQFRGLRSPENDALYAQASIIDNLDNLDDQSVILAHGDSDRTVPYAQSRILSEALAEADYENTEFITLKNEDHVYAEPESFEELCERMIEFVGGKAPKRCSI